MAPPPSSAAGPAIAAYSATSRQVVGLGGNSSNSNSNSNFFDSLLSPQQSAAMSGTTSDAELPPLPKYIGTAVAQGDAVDQLHGAIARAPCGVVLQIENRTKQILTLRSCALSTAEAGPRWQIPPPSGVESEAIACFGATTTSAAEVGGRFTLVDAARHSYHLEFGTSSGGTTGGGSARGKVTLEAARPGQTGNLGAPLQHTWRPGTTAGGIPEVTFVLEPASA